MRRSSIAWFMGLIFLATIALRLYELDVLPGAWYGDISIVHDYVSAIQSGQWPFYYALSAGPLYHYLIAPIIALLGDSYLAYKLASVAISLIAVAATGLLAREVGGARLGLLAAFVAGVSSWLLVFSRLGNSQIAIPALTALTGYFLARYLRTGRRRDAIVGAVVSTLGLYSYPQSSILPLVYVLILAVYTVWEMAAASRGGRVETLHAASLPASFSKGSGGGQSRPPLLQCCLLIGLLGLPFAAIVLHQPDNFRAGYLGEKLFGAGQYGVLNFPVALGKNILTSLLSLNVAGDGTFRSNPPHAPQLDVVSGVLLILGLVSLATGSRRRYLPLILLSIFFLIIPASWPYLPPAEIPSASRTIGITPFVYLLVAEGLLWVYGLVRGPVDGKLQQDRRQAASAVMGLALAGILALNVARYFGDYAWNLPNHNVAFDRVIAAEIDQLPADAGVYVGGCCWGDWGQPDPAGLEHQIAVPRKVSLLDDRDFSRDDIERAPAGLYFFWDPRDQKDGFAKLQTMFPGGTVSKKLDQYGDVVYLEYAAR